MEKRSFLHVIIVTETKWDVSLQASYDMLKASGNAAVIMMSSIAGGPTTVNSGAPYAMTKGEPLSIQILEALMLASCIQFSS